MLTATSEVIPKNLPKSDALTINSQPGLLEKISAHYSVAPEIFKNLMKTVAMPSGHTTDELISCLIVAWEHKLNPLTKEIYFMRTKAGTIQPIVGVDGWIRKLNEHSQYDGIEFEWGPTDKDSLAEWCDVIITMKNRARPVKIREWLKECKAAGGSVWKTSPMRMLRNRTLCQGARIAVGFAGVMTPDEFDDWQSREKSPHAVKSTLPELVEIYDSDRIVEDAE